MSREIVGGKVIEEVVIVDPSTGEPTQHNWSTQMDYDANGNIIYLGIADPGTSTSSPNWYIRKLTYDVNSNLTGILHSNGSTSFNVIWNNRASLSYS